MAETHLPLHTQSAEIGTRMNYLISWEAHERLGINYLIHTKIQAETEVYMQCQQLWDWPLKWNSKWVNLKCLLCWCFSVLYQYTASSLGLHRRQTQLLRTKSFSTFWQLNIWYKSAWCHFQMSHRSGIKISVWRSRHLLRFKYLIK